MKLQSVKFALPIFHRGKIATFSTPHGAKTFKQIRDFINNAISNHQPGNQAPEEFRFISDAQHARAILASAGEDDLAGKVMRQQHQPLTDSQDGNAERKNLWIDLRSAFVINAGWSAGKNDTVGFQRGDFRGWRVEANNFRIHLAFAHTAGYDLRVLRSEIEEKNL